MSSVVQSVDRALDILELLSYHVEGLSIKEISEALDYHKSTVHRLLGTLIQKGYVSQNQKTAHYHVTLKLFQLGSRKVEKLDLIQLSKPYLNKLARISGEVVHLVLRDQQDIIYVDKVEGDQIIRMHSHIGQRRPMYCTAVGKAILSTLPVEEVEKVFVNSTIEALTEKTITTIDQLLQERELIIRKGYALDQEENEIGVTCVAVAIVGMDGMSQGAISISGPTQRMVDKTQEYGEQLKNCAREISKELGYIE